MEQPMFDLVGGRGEKPARAEARNESSAFARLEYTPEILVEMSETELHAHLRDTIFDIGVGSEHERRLRGEIRRRASG